MYAGRGLLVFEPTPGFHPMKAIIPNLKELTYKGIPHVAVKHDLDTVNLLRNCGIEAPSPVNHGWKYPGLHQPFQHQKATVEFLTLNRRGFILNGLGSGKTKSALWAAEYLMQQGLVRQVAIFCPKSCVHKVWEDELFHTLTNRTVAVVEGGSRERKRELAESGADYLIVNHDGLPTIHDLLHKNEAIDLIIWDEASNLRNSQTRRYRMLKETLRPNTRLWLLTATPCPNAPTDAWALARLVRPESVPPYFLAFKRQTMIQLSTYKWIPKPEGLQAAFDALQPGIRFRTEDCIDLPPVTYQNRSCELSEEQETLMEEMARHYVSDTGATTITAANAAVRLTKMLQLAAGCVYDDFGDVTLVDSSDRLNVLKEIIEEADHKVIVWVPFKHVMRHLLEELSKVCSAELINGDTPAGERTRIITAFQDIDSDPKVLIAHPATAAHGLTLTSANICVWYGPTFSSELYEQANARIIRPGQRHHMTIIHMGGSDVEWEAYSVAKSKLNRQKKILDLYRKTIDNPV